MPLHRQSRALAAFMTSTHAHICRPVHDFLLRHVYVDLQRGSHSGLRRGLSPSLAMYATFAASIIAHEAVIWAVLTPTYPPPVLALLSCVQFPLLNLMRLPAFRGTALGNLFFWSSLQTGSTMIVVLYARYYCSTAPAMCTLPGASVQATSAAGAAACDVAMAPQPVAA